MSKTTKTIALLAAIVLVCGIAAAVAVTAITYDPTSAKPGLYLDDQRVKEPAVALTIDGHEISFNVYRYYFLLAKDQISTDPEYWLDDADGAKLQKVKDNAIYFLRYVYAYNAFGEQQGIGLTQEDFDEVDAKVRSEKRAQGTAFKSFLRKGHYADEETYRLIQYDVRLMEKMSDAYGEWLADNVPEDYTPNGTVTAKHILFSLETYGDDETALAQALQAEAEIREAVENGEDLYEVFEEYRAEYDTDPGQQQEGYVGYTFGPGEMVEEFYQGALALGVYEMSEPIGTSYGYHIIFRLPIEDDAREEAYGTEHLEELQQSLEIEYGSQYDEYNLETIK